MYINKIQNYQIQSQNVIRKNQNIKASHVYDEQLNFKSRKGMAIGGLAGVLTGVGIIVATEGVALLTSNAALLSGIFYGGVGSLVGEALSSDDKK